MMELQIILATLFRRYSFVPERPDQVVSVVPIPRSLCLIF